MELFRIVRQGKKYYVKCLVYNPNVWCASQWRYLFVTDNYPTEQIRHAKQFTSRKSAQDWVKENVQH